MTALTEQQQQEIIDLAFEQIKTQVIETAGRQASWQIEREIATSISGIVSEFIKAEIAPEIIVSLNENKSVIIQAAITAAEEMARLLAQNMTAQLAENLGSSYKRDKIFKEMFS